MRQPAPCSASSASGSRLIDLAALLKLPVEQLLAPVEARPEPVVAYRMRNDHAPTAEAQEAGNEVARHLRQPVPLTAGLETRSNLTRVHDWHCWRNRLHSCQRGQISAPAQGRAFDAPHRSDLPLPA